VTYKSWYEENKVLCNFQIALFILCIVLAFLIKPIVDLSENQILYFFSTSSQVIAGLYGLTLTGFIFFNDKLNERVKEDETLYDAVEIMKARQYSQIKIMGLFCIACISSSLTIINTFNVKYENLYKDGFDYLLNQSMVLIFTEIVLIVLFSWYSMNPKSIDKINEYLKKQNEYDTSLEEGNFQEFLKYYNGIESMIIRQSNNLTNFPVFEVSIKNNKFYRPNILDALKILISAEIIDKELADNINELRKYRNSVVHAEEPQVSKKASEDIKKIYERLNLAINP
jgi:uncharacterized protein YutE (UPF0331/DUF86 family)